MRNSECGLRNENPKCGVVVELARHPEPTKVGHYKTRGFLE